MRDLLPFPDKDHNKLINTINSLSINFTKMFPLYPEIAKFRYILNLDESTKHFKDTMKTIMMRNTSFQISDQDHAILLTTMHQLYIHIQDTIKSSVQRALLWTAVQISQTHFWVEITDWILQVSGLDLFQLTEIPQITPRPKKRRNKNNYAHVIFQNHFL